LRSHIEVLAVVQTLLASTFSKVTIYLAILAVIVILALAVGKTALMRGRKRGYSFPATPESVHLAIGNHTG
jgi:hypothetical protein